MSSANQPSGPGQLKKEIEAAVVQQEGLDELEAERSDAPLEGDAQAADAATRARHAERDAHSRDNDSGKR